MALILSSAYSLAFCAEEKSNFIAPSQLPQTQREMKTPGFWISRHPAPDQVVLTPQEIAAFNDHVQNELKLTKDIFAITENLKTESLMSSFDKILADFSAKEYYTADGVRNDPALMERLRRNMNLSGVVLGIAPRYGLVVHYADQRFFPTKEGLYETAGDIDFDQVQNSTLDVGTPVAVVHQSADKKWYYVLAPLSDGWVEAGRVALGDMKTVKNFASAKNFVVVTSPKADIFLNESMTDQNDYARMGVRLPLLEVGEARKTVQVPLLDAQGKLQLTQGYVASTDVHEGYLSYTSRNIYHQAFALLDAPYGWGGMYGQQDCSAFLDEVFSTVGLVLPRDSKDQSQIGTTLTQFDEKFTGEQKLQAFKDARGAVAILPMKGHIMLYLGMADERPYAIHAIWAYRERRGDKDVPRVINKVTVSDLSLGEGSYKGSLLKRLSKIIEVK